METPGWVKRIAGEIAKLRITIKIGTGGTTYKLDSSRVDAALARSLYDNNNDKYKLGAAFCRRIINAKWGFMGVPKFRSDDPDAQLVLDAFCQNNVSRMSLTHKKALIEGDCIVWITNEEVDSALYPESTSNLVYNIIPFEELKGIVRNPITRQPSQYRFESETVWYDDAANEKKTKISQIVTAEKRTIKQDGDKITDLEDEITNVWGFIPIIHFKNEEDPTREYGQSELEPVEPFIKAYHDLLLSAIEGSKMHSTPRLYLKLKDVAAFLQNNFGVDDPKKFVQEEKTVDIDGKELLILQNEEDVGFVEIKSPSGGVETLLKFLFYCIVDVSEVPEFIFGVHTPSALSSVKEQMPVFDRTITRKRQNVTDSWKRLARIVLAMTAQATGKKFSTYAVDLEWEEIDPRDEKEFADTLKAFTEALNQAIEGKFCSAEAAAAFLQKYVPTMRDYDPTEKDDRSERERIIGNAIERERMADGATNLDEVNAGKDE